MPFLTLQLTPIEQMALLASDDLASPLRGEVEDRVEILPEHRRPMAEAIKTIAEVFEERIREKHDAHPSNHQIIVGLARRVARGNAESTAISLDERTSLLEAQKASGKAPKWLRVTLRDEAVKVLSEGLRRPLARSIRDFADHVLDRVADARREEDWKMVRALHGLSTKVASLSCILETDLRDITCSSDICRTVIHIGDDPWGGQMRKWLEFGKSTVRFDVNPTRLYARLRDGTTDFEHDPANAVVLPLIGVKLVAIRGNTTILEAYIAPRMADEFHVPWPEYNPFESEEISSCVYNSCDGHPMVPSSLWAPPTNEELYREVEGKYIRIHIGPAPRS